MEKPSWKKRNVAVPVRSGIFFFRTLYLKAGTGHKTSQQPPHLSNKQKPKKGLERIRVTAQYEQAQAHEKIKDGSLGIMALKVCLFGE